jgi:hypothetical protein
MSSVHESSNLSREDAIPPVQYELQLNIHKKDQGYLSEVKSFKH